MAWYHRLANLLRSRSHADELDREMSFHLAERADDLVARGMDASAAQYEARRRFGNRGLQKEAMRGSDVALWLESLLADVRYALRSMRATPGFSLVAVLSLGLGIGANTAIFSLIDAVMLRSLPVARPEELVKVSMGSEGAIEFTNPLWETIRDHQDALQGAFAFSNENTFNIAASGVARKVTGDYVSGSYFGVLGVRPALGRVLGTGDDLRGCPATADVSYGFWQREYGGDASVLGRTLSLEGHPFEIVGVVDPSFTGTTVGRRPDVFVPLCSEAIVHGSESGLDNRSYWFIQIMGRRRAGLTLDQTRARLTAIAPGVFEATLPPRWPVKVKEEYLHRTLTAWPADAGLSAVRAGYDKALLILMAVVGVVLLIACANVANLLLARATARSREMAVRVALGAGRGRLVRQLLTESLLLAVTGAATGVLFARWATRVLMAMLGTSKGSVWLDLSLDGRVLAFTIAVAVATGLVFGLAPAWRATRVDPQAAMKPGARVVEGHTRLTMVKSLVVGQLALSFVLLAAAGLLLGTFRGLATLDPGFHPGGVLLVTLNRENTGRTIDAERALDRQLVDRLRAMPGVRSASASTLTPVSGSGWNGFVDVDGYVPTDERDRLVFFNAVTEGYFATLGTRVLAGREFTDRDGPQSPRVAVVNEAMAHRFFGATDPVGRIARMQDGDGPGDPVQIVGVVRDTKYRDLREQAVPQLYIPLAQKNDMWGLNFELRADGDATALIAPATRTILDVDRGSSITFATLADQVAATLTRERLLAALSGFFGALAIALAMIGLYGTMSYSVARRRNEIGIRLALGAARGRVIGMVVGEVGRLVVIGVAIGVAFAIASTRLIASFLYGLTPTDTTTLTASATILVLVAMAAGAVPAWRAARLNPVETLREE